MRQFPNTEFLLTLQNLVKTQAIKVRFMMVSLDKGGCKLIYIQTSGKTENISTMIYIKFNMKIFTASLFHTVKHESMLRKIDNLIDNL